MATMETAGLLSTLGKLRHLQDGETVVIHAGRVLTGRLKGERELADQAIVIESGAITAVAPWAGFTVPDGVTVIDASDRTVMPGMIETHVHVTGEWAHDPHGTHLEPFGEARAIRGLLDTWAVMNGGFTSIFSMGHGHPSMVSSIKALVEKEGLPGPRIYHCGWALSQTAGHGHVRDWDYELVKELKPRAKFVDGPWEVRSVVRENLGNGADFTKLYSGEGGFTAGPYIGRRLDFTAEEIQAATDESHRLGFQVSSHCMTIEHVRHAVDNGVDRVEHGPVGYDPTFIPYLLEKGATWCPTLSQLHWGLAETTKRGLSQAQVEKIKGGIIGRVRMIQEGLDAGLTIGFGTDNRMRPKAGQNAIELKIMTDNGIAPLDVIAIATSQAAKLVGLDANLGIIEPGKLADLLVVNGNPAEDITALVDHTRIEQILTSPRKVNPRAFHARAEA